MAFETELSNIIHRTDDISADVSAELVATVVVLPNI